MWTYWSWPALCEANRHLYDALIHRHSTSETRLANVTIYTREFCPYCTRALALLKGKDVELEHIDAGLDPAKKAEMVQRSGGGRTFPQIFINGDHVGGCDDLMALERAGKLDALLAAG